MSQDLRNLAFDTRLPPGPRFVLVLLADKADSTGTCWPGLDFVAAKTGMNPQTVSRHMRQLAREGYIERHRRRQRSATCTVLRERLLADQDLTNHQVSQAAEPGTEPPQDLTNHQVSTPADGPDLTNRQISVFDLTNHQVSTGVSAAQGGKDGEAGSIEKREIVNPQPQVKTCEFIKSGLDESSNPLKGIISESSERRCTQPERSPDEPAATGGRDNQNDHRSDDRADTRKLCERLADAMVANSCKRPTITARWLTDARLLLDRDQRPLDEALAVLDWSQADAFEQVNIHSIRKLRARYDQLRMKADRAGALAENRRVPTDPDEALEWVRQQWRDAAVTGIETATGLRYESPDLPLHITTKEQAETYLREHRQDWINHHIDDIVRRLTKGHVA